MSSEKRKIAYIDGKPYEIGANHTSILKFVKRIFLYFIGFSFQVGIHFDIKYLDIEVVLAAFFVHRFIFGQV